MKLYKKTTYYSTYSAFCDGFKNYIVESELMLNNKMATIYLALHERLNKIYNLSPNKSFDYIFNFFTQEKWKDYEKVVMLMNENFKNSLN